jgi:hypothetical protein
VGPEKGSSYRRLLPYLPGSESGTGTSMTKDTRDRVKVRCDRNRGYWPLLLRHIGVFACMTSLLFGAFVEHLNSIASSLWLPPGFESRFIQSIVALVRLSCAATFVVVVLPIWHWSLTYLSVWRK